MHHVLTYPRIASQVRLEDSEPEMVLAALLSEAQVVPGHPRLPGVTRNPKDGAIVACAQEGRAGYLVSGDQDLLALGESGGIQIISPRQFVELVLSLEGCS